MIEHVDKIVGLRRNLVLGGGALPGRADRRRSTTWSATRTSGASPRARGSTGPRACRSTVPTAAQVVERGGPDAVAELECLYWVGCAASFDDRNRRVARAFVTCLNAAGREVRGARPGRVVHGRSGAPDGQRVRLPDARDGQRRDAQPLQAEDDRHGLPALLQHDRQRVRPARRPLRRRPPLAVPVEAGERRPAARRRRPTASSRSPSTTRATWRATTA